MNDDPWAGLISEGADPRRGYPPLRDLRDIEAIEATPIESRIRRWDMALNLVDGCDVDPSRAAVIAADRGVPDRPLVTWSFADLKRRSLQVANLLRARGIGPDDAVAIVAPTVPGLYAALIGGLLAARPFPINWFLDTDALRDLFGRAGVKAVIALRAMPGFAIHENVVGACAGLEAKPLLLTLHDPFGAPDADDLLIAAEAQPGDRLAFDRPVATRNRIAAYVHSGGTTGHPKIVKVTHGGLVYRQWTTNVGLGMSARDVILSDTPLFHIGGLVVRGLATTATGATSVIPSLMGARDKTYMANYWRFVERFGITQVSGVPTTLSVLAKNPPTGENLTSLRPYFFTSSTAIAPAVQERIGAVTGARALMAYGLTENTSNATATPRDGDSRIGCSGMRVPYTEIRIGRLDAHGRIAGDCPAGETGMILLRGPGVCAGYLDPAHDRGTLLADGTLVTGDLGSLDAEGYLRISGRKKDLIIRSGHNIEPGMIEDALLKSPWVAQAAAVGKPDAHAGELPVAYVELHAGASVTVDELMRYAAEHIAERPAVPKEIVILDRMPLTAVGKPIKQTLQREAAERAFREALRPVPGDWRLEVGGAAGALAVTLTLPGANAEAHAAAERILSSYSTPYVIAEA